MPQAPLPFPLKGIHQGTAHNAIPDLYSPDAMNVAPFDAGQGRGRGGQRDGVSKWYSQTVNGSNSVQHLNKSVALAGTTTSAVVWTYFPTPAQPVGYGLDYDPVSKGLYYVDGRSATNNTYRLDEDGVLVWDELVHGGGEPSCAINDTGDVLFVSGNRSSSKTVWAVNASTGAVIASFDTGASNEPSHMSVVDTASGSRLVVGTSAAHGATDQVYVLDYDQTAQTFTNTWSFVFGSVFTGIGGVSGVDRVWIDPANTDKIYACGTQSVAGDNPSVGKATVSTQTLDWEFQFTHSGMNGGIILGIGGDGGSNLYLAHTRYTDVTARSVSKINDPASGTPTVSASADPNSTASSANGVKYVSDTEVWVGLFTSSAGSVVFKYDSSLQLQNAVSAGSVTATTQGLDADGSGNVYVGANPSAGTDGSVFKLNPLNVGELTRSTTVLAVSGGSTYKITRSTVTNALASTSIGTSTLVTGNFKVDSVEFNGKFYIVDGANYRVVNPATPTDSDWAAAMTTGTLPSSGSNTARQVSLYRGRVALFSIVGDDQNIHFLKVGDPLVNNVLPTTIDGLEAVAINSSEAGRIGDIVNCGIPYSDDLFVIGGDHTVQVLRGDPSPVNGGRVDMITDSIGMWFGKCYTFSPNGELYFMGTDGVYRMLISGDQVSRPDTLSGLRISEAIHNLDPSTRRAQLAWSVRRDGLFVYLTSHASVDSTHWFWCRRTDSWWKLQYPIDLGPTCAFEFDGDDPTDRAVLIGGRDGYIRQVDYRAKDDDGTAIDGYVWFNPMRFSGEEMEFAIRKIAVTLGSETDAVSYSVHVGDDVESALAATASFSGTFTGGGRQSLVRSRARGNCVIFKLYNSTANSSWSYESGSVEAQQRGPVRV